MANATTAPADVEEGWTTWEGVVDIVGFCILLLFSLNPTKP